MESNEDPAAIEFIPLSTEEGMICAKCPIKNNCVYPDGMGCVAIRTVRLTRAAEMKSVRKCNLSDQYRTYDILGGFSITRWFNKKRTKVIAKIRERHPVEKVKPEKDSCECVVSLRLVDRSGKTVQTVQSEDLEVDFSNEVILDYGYAHMTAVREKLSNLIYKWHDTRSVQ